MIDANKKFNPEKWYQIEFVQVKEKFASIRVYTDGANDDIMGAINFAEYLSGSICEECGIFHSNGITTIKGWQSSLCAHCAAIVRSET